MVPSIQGYTRYLNTMAESRTTSSHTDLWAAKTRLMRLRADKAEIELEQRMAGLLNTAEVEIAWNEPVQYCRERILRIPAEAAPILAQLTNPAGIMVAMDDIIREALDELAAYNG